MSAFTDEQLESIEKRLKALEDEYVKLMMARSIIAAPAGSDAPDRAEVEKATRKQLDGALAAEARKRESEKPEPAAEATPPPKPRKSSNGARASAARTQPPEGPMRLGDLMAAAGLGIEEVEITEEQARDVFVTQRKPFTSQVLMDAYDISRRQADQYMTLYCEKGVIKHVRGRAATAQYEYVPPDPSLGPRERPRHDSPRGDAAKMGKQPVAGTGRQRADLSVTGRRRPGRTHGGKPRA